MADIKSLFPIRFLFVTSAEPQAVICRQLISCCWCECGAAAADRTDWGLWAPLAAAAAALALIVGS